MMARAEAWEGVVDVRSEEEFARGHAVGATWVPLGQLETLLCALPPRDIDPTKRRALAVVARTAPDAAHAARLIEAAGYAVVRVSVAEDDAPERLPLTSAEPSRRLWRPNAFLARCIAAIEACLCSAGASRTALDVACGSGRDAAFLACRGWRVRGVDNNPRLLAVARVLCAHERVCGPVDFAAVDVAAPSALAPRPPEPLYTLVHVARFLHRPLLGPGGGIDVCLAPGGFVVYSTFMVGCTKPSKPKHLLNAGELRDAFAAWQIVAYEETRLDDGRPVQCLCARKPPVDHCHVSSGQPMSPGDQSDPSP